jgi:hypothetical protein
MSVMYPWPINACVVCLPSANQCIWGLLTLSQPMHVPSGQPQLTIADGRSYDTWNGLAEASVFVGQPIGYVNLHPQLANACAQV